MKELLKLKVRRNAYNIDINAKEFRELFCTDRLTIAGPYCLNNTQLWLIICFAYTRLQLVLSE